MANRVGFEVSRRRRLSVKRALTLGSTRTGNAMRFCAVLWSNGWVDMVPVLVCRAEELVVGMRTRIALLEPKPWISDWHK